MTRDPLYSRLSNRFSRLFRALLVFPLKRAYSSIRLSAIFLYANYYFFFHCTVFFIQSPYPDVILSVCVRGGAVQSETIFFDLKGSERNVDAFKRNTCKMYIDAQVKIHKYIEKYVCNCTNLCIIK